MSAKEFPPKVKSFPFLGELFNLKKEGVDFYFRMQCEYGDAVTVPVLFSDYYLFFHPDHNREILQTKEHLFIKGSQYDQLRLIFGKSVLTSNGEDWKRQRRMLNPIFNKKGLDCLLIPIKEKTDEFIHLLNEGKMDASKEMYDYTLNVAIHSFFGSNFTQKERESVTIAANECIRFVSKRMANIYNIPLWFPTESQNRFKENYQTIKKATLKIYNNKLKNKKDGNDILQLLMDARDENGSRLNKEEIFDNILAFLFAGHETTALTLGWALLQLAQFPKIQNKIRDEIIQNKGEFASSSDVKKYPYLNAALEETMRLFPSGWVIARNISENTTVGKFKVNKNKVLAICPLLTHRDPRWWVEPLKFIPERFLMGDKLQHKAPAGAYLPFSLGRRNCIGAQFSIIEMNYFLIQIIKRFTLQTEQVNIGLKGHVTLKPSQAIEIEFKKI